VDVLRDQALVRVEAELRLERLEGLRGDRALELAQHRQGRVARHQPRQQEVQRDRNPQRQHKEAQAAQHEPHAVLPAGLMRSS
jgi:hypothetical protein